MIIDTDVLIWDMRGNVSARKIIASEVPFAVSVVTYIELLQGLKNKQELQILVKQFKTWSTTILQIDRDISTRAMFYIEDFFLSHRMELADALIAATAIESNLPLLTANTRHYRHIPHLQLVPFSA